MNRRDWLRTASAFAAAVGPLSSQTPGRPASGPPERPAIQHPNDALSFGVCSYSVREFQRNLAIRMLSQLGVRYVSVKDAHLPYNSTAQEIARARAAFEKAGLQIVSGGNMPLESDDERELRGYFDYAKRCRMPMIVGAPTARSLPILEKLVKEYDIRLAVHNHGPEDPHFPSPQSVLKQIGNMDPRVGLCVDAGHTMRAGADVVQSLVDAGPRLFEMHMKDLRSPTDKASQCDVGDGVMPTVAILKQLKQMNYKGCVNLEYEINGDNPLPGMLHSLGYLRGALAGLTT